MPDVAVCIVHLSDVFSSSQSLWGSAFCNMSLIACYWLLLTVSLFVVCVSCFCFVFSFMLNNICLLKCLISLCSSWTDRATNYVYAVCCYYCLLFICFQVTVSASLRILLWHPMSPSSSAGTNPMVTWTCCTTSGTKWFRVGTVCSPLLRSVWQQHTCVAVATCSFLLLV